MTMSNHAIPKSIAMFLMLWLLAISVSTCMGVPVVERYQRNLEQGVHLDG